MQIQYVMSEHEKISTEVEIMRLRSENEELRSIVAKHLMSDSIEIKRPERSNYANNMEYEVANHHYEFVVMKWVHYFNRNNPK